MSPTVVQPQMNVNAPNDRRLDGPTQVAMRRVMPSIAYCYSCCSDLAPCTVLHYRAKRYFASGFHVLLLAFISQ